MTWVSVKERLPEARDMVLVASPMWCWPRISYHDGRHWRDPNSLSEGCEIKITHWQFPPAMPITDENNSDRKEGEK